MADEIIINSRLKISRSELHFKFSRSGGPGGQNVNKVETRVELLFDVQHSPSLSEAEREHVFKYSQTKIDNDGMLHVVAQDSRSQWKNRQEAVQRFAALLQKALKPKKKRIATKTPTAAKQKRLEEKKRRSKIIRSRRIDE